MVTGHVWYFGDELSDRTRPVATPDTSDVATGRVWYFIQTSGSQTEVTGHVRCIYRTRPIFGPEVSDSRLCLRGVIGR